MMEQLENKLEELKQVLKYGNIIIPIVISIITVLITIIVDKKTQKDGKQRDGKIS